MGFEEQGGSRVWNVGFSVAYLPVPFKLMVVLVVGLTGIGT